MQICTCGLSCLHFYNPMKNYSLFTADIFVCNFRLQNPCTTTRLREDVASTVSLPFPKFIESFHSVRPSKHSRSGQYKGTLKYSLTNKLFGS